MKSWRVSILQMEELCRLCNDQFRLREQCEAGRDDRVDDNELEALAAFRFARAAAGADHLLITSDNPRSEDAGAIIADILTGLPASASAQVQADRAIAIATALQQAGAQDVVLIAGKGHENYQEIRGQKLPFSDRAVAQAALASYTPQDAGAGA